MVRSRSAQSFADALFRVSFSGIFLIAAFNHFSHPDVILGRLEAAPLAHLATGFLPASFLVHASGVVLAVAGLALLVGLATPAAALVLAAVLVPITLTVHIGNPGHLGPLFKNVALMGGLLHFATRGGGAWSVDEAWRRGRARAVAPVAAGAVLLAALGLGAAPSHAAPGPDAGAAEAIRPGAVFLVQNPAQVGVVLETAKTLEDQGTPEVEVVACGKAVPALEGEPALAPAVKGGVKVVACGLTLKKLGLSPADLPTGVTAVPNGLVEVLRLQAEGFHSVEL